MMNSALHFNLKFTAKNSLSFGITSVIYALACFG